MMKKRYLRRTLIILGHALISAASLICAFLLRFDFNLPIEEIDHLRVGLWIAVPLKMLVFQFAGLQRGWWRFAGLTDIYRLTLANALSSFLFVCLTRVVVGSSFPRSVYIIDFVLCFLVTCEARFAARIFRDFRNNLVSKAGAKGVLIYGAGSTGVTLLREIRSNPDLNLHVLGFLDDDAQKRRMNIMGVRVLGAGRDAARIKAKLRNAKCKVDEIIIAIPVATGKQMREAVANCRNAGVPCKTVPALTDILQNKVLSGQLREVSVSDLLGREAVQLDEEVIRQHLAGRNVLVSGGAGSIGSELCRQIAVLKVRKLVVFDQAESDLYRIEIELHRQAKEVDIVIELGDIRDYGRIEEVMDRHSIELVFHAAAYKHVPMMEAHLVEAVKNNILGTWNLVRAAHRRSVLGFVMISSDKAVNPTSIMGTTKRVAELIVSAMSSTQGGHTNFVSVRFGNVLGSNGSVIPLFQSQIASGGPVTVTHPEMRRYFMTIREAVQLVLQASTMGRGSETFVLDMGEPIRILDMAKNMIRLTGLQPDEDIDIRFIGLRPGEKLYEELLCGTDEVVPTRHKKINICRSVQPGREEIIRWISEMERLIATRNARAIRLHLKILVPEYTGLPEAAPVTAEHSFKTVTA